MKKIYKALLAPIDKEGFSINDICTRVKLSTAFPYEGIGHTIISTNDYNSPNEQWQAQRLIITSDEKPSPNDITIDENLVLHRIHDLPNFKIGETDKKVIASYPNISGTAQIDITDVIKWVDNGCSESVGVEVRFISHSSVTGRVEKPILTNNTVKMVWDNVDYGMEGCSNDDKLYYESGNMTKDMLQSKQNIEDAAKDTLKENKLPIDDEFAEGFLLGAIMGENWEKSKPIFDMVTAHIEDLGFKKKTKYDEKINTLAEEFAKYHFKSKSLDWSIASQELKQIYIDKVKPLAAIALKHMAHMYEVGYLTAMAIVLNGHDMPPQLKEQLQSLGLIQP